MGSETALSDSDVRVAAVVDSLDEPAFLLDESDTVLHLNQAAAEILAVGRDQIAGRSLGELDHVVSCARIRAALERARSSAPGEPRVEIELNSRGCERTYVLRPASMRRQDGTSFGILLLLHDVSRLGDENRPQDNGIVAVAQELNTPLTSLSLAVGLLQREAEKQNELISEITEDVDRLNHASADFLNVIRVQPGSIALRSVAFDLGTVFAAVFRKFEHRILHRKIEFAIHAERNLTVNGDPLMLSWVIATLVGNALSHTPQMGTVDLIAEKEDALIRITVRDSGPGIPADTRELVFGGSLRTADGAIQSIETGFSLGVAREIAEAHGGRLFADGSEEGASVTLTLPLSQEI